MGRYINPGNANFETIRRMDYFVDKSELLHYLNTIIDTDRKLCCVSFPRKFGKSVIAGMIRAYYGIGYDTSDLFDNLKIAFFPEYKVHLNEYNVISLDIANLRAIYKSSQKDDPQLVKFLTYIQSDIIKELNNLFPSVISFHDKNLSLAEALWSISLAREVKFIFVIDEWDCFFREDKDNLDLQKEYITLLRSLFKGEHTDRYLHLVYMTGILPIKKYGTQSALNNFREYNMLLPRNFAKFIGFSEEEVKQLCVKFNTDLYKIQQWYDGYKLAEIASIYNPNSVIEAITSGVVDDYWCQTESFDSLQKYINLNFDGLEDAIISLLAGDLVLIDTSSFLNDFTNIASKDDVLTLMVHLGYLVFQRDSEEDDLGYVRIPNREIRSQFRSVIKKNNLKNLANILERSKKLLEYTWNLDEKEVAKGLEQAHEDFSSNYDYNSEEALRYIIQLAYYAAQSYYTFLHEFPSGKGRADVIFMPTPVSDKIPIIVELKYNRSATSAFKQIKTKNYMGKLTAYPEVLLVGVNYSKKTKKHTCKIEKWKF